MKIFIVDDDPLARLVTTNSLEEQGFTMIELEDGQACLGRVEEQPDIIILDVEMDGLDGIATCRALRQDGHERPHVLFISSHDDMETRLAAYDAGGNDFLVKPFMPDELTRKIRQAIGQLELRDSLASRADMAQTVAFSAMSSMGEMGAVLEFMRKSFLALSPRELAQEIFNTLGGYGLQGAVEIRSPDHAPLHFSSQGSVAPLESAILEYARNLPRIVQSAERMVINYPLVTLLIPQLPQDDPDRVGRLRDHLAIVAEAAEARLQALGTENLRLAQAEAIVQAVTQLSVTLEEIEKRQQEQRLQAQAALIAHLHEMEDAFVRLGLSSDQENALIRMARAALEDQSASQAGQETLEIRLREVVRALNRAIQGKAVRQ